MFLCVMVDALLFRGLPMIFNKLPWTIVILVLLTFFLSSFVLADFTPQGDINLRNRSDIINGQNATFYGLVSAGDFIGDGSQLTNITSSVANTSISWANLTNVNESMFDKVGSILNLQLSFLDLLYAPLRGFFSLLSNFTSQVTQQQADNSTQALQISNQITVQGNDNSTQASLLDLLRSDNDTQAAEIVLKHDLTDQ